MTEPVGPVETIARRMRELRRKRGLTAQQLGEAMAELGIPWDRNVVSALETGRRSSVSVIELLGLGYILGVSPVALVIPMDDEEPYRVLPARTEPAGTAREWFTGATPLPGMNEVTFWADAHDAHRRFYEEWQGWSQVTAQQEEAVKGIAETVEEFREQHQEYRRGYLLLGKLIGKEGTEEALRLARQQQELEVQVQAQRLAAEEVKEQRQQLQDLIDRLQRLIAQQETGRTDG